MSYLLSGLNIQNIAEYDSAQSYEKYDIVDYQLNSGISVYPSYTGFANNNLSFWFDNDLFEDFQINSQSNVTGWRNKVISTYLTQEDSTKAPYIDFNYNFLNLVGTQNLTGQINVSDYKTIFLCFNASPANNYDFINILQISDVNDISSESGFLKISGSDVYGSAKIFIDDMRKNAVSPLYNTPNIITLIQTTGSSGPYVDVEVRQNGYSLGEYNNVYSGWASGFLGIGNNSNDKSIKYYDLFCFNSGLDETNLNYYEKYLFEKYFALQQGLYFAKNDVNAGAFNSPITYTGINYWTRNIDDLFKLSYGCSANFSSKLNSINFGDGYRSNIINTINSLDSEFNLTYDGLTDKQAKCLITYFENTPEAPNKSLYEGYKGVEMNLFPPYKSDAEIYFLDISHSTPYNDINKIVIKGQSLYESILDYSGMFVQFDRINIREYSDDLSNFSFNDIVYFGGTSSSYINDYYFYTGSDITSTLNVDNNPTGVNSLFTKNFYFKEDVEYEIQSKLRVRNQEYRNGAKQIAKDGINYNTLEFDLKFTKRSDKEALAILKFLDNKAGYRLFNYTLPQPYNKTMQVYCPEWSHTHEFKNNNSINAKFIEYRGQAVTNTFFSTKLLFVEDID